VAHFLTTIFGSTYHDHLQLGHIMAQRQRSKGVAAGSDSSEKKKPAKSYVSMIRAFFGIGGL
jgi:hypothetical protein